MKKLQRYDPPRSYTKPIPWIKDEDGDWCNADDVARLEASYAELKTALEYAINIYGRFGAVVNEPYNPGIWIDVAKRAIENAEDLYEPMEKMDDLKWVHPTEKENSIRIEEERIANDTGEYAKMMQDWVEYERKCFEINKPGKK